MQGAMTRLGRRHLIAAVLGVALFGPAVGPSQGARNVVGAEHRALRAAGTLEFRFALRWTGSDRRCPLGTPVTIECYPHPGGPELAPGLGLVSQSYLYFVEGSTAPDCVAGYNIADYPARLIVEGKGEINLLVKGIDTCLQGEPVDTVVTNVQSFTITGGSGVYAGASGSGEVSHVAHRLISGHPAGTDTWKGTLIVPDLEFDLVPPTIRGAANRIVRAPRGLTRVRVLYQVTAVDDRGRATVACRPRSGSLFKVGRTRVICSATDTSGNRAAARFTVTVRPSR
jgi:HYR domain